MGPIILQEPNNVLDRISRGLAGYVSYLAACEMNDAFTEYVLYEPILRILIARGFSVDCEVKCPGADHPALGEKKRLDFKVEGKGLLFAIEVKWVKAHGDPRQEPRDPGLPPLRLDVAADHAKLLAFLNHDPSARSFLAVFGRESCLNNLQLDPNNFEVYGETRIAGFDTTRFGCSMYQLPRQPPGQPAGQ